MPGACLCFSLPFDVLQCGAALAARVCQCGGGTSVAALAYLLARSKPWFAAGLDLSFRGLCCRYPLCIVRVMGLRPLAM